MSNSQKHQLLEEFKRGKVLTADSAFDKFRIGTFSQRIKDIEREGYTIARSWVTSPSGKKFMRYWLVKEQVAA